MVKWWAKTRNHNGIPARRFLYHGVNTLITGECSVWPSFLQRVYGSHFEPGVTLYMDSAAKWRGLFVSCVAHCLYFLYPPCTFEVECEISTVLKQLAGPIGSC